MFPPIELNSLHDGHAGCHLPAVLATPHQSTGPSNAEMVETTDASSSSAAPVGAGCDTWLWDSEDDVSSVSAPVVS